MVWSLIPAHAGDSMLLLISAVIKVPLDRVEFLSDNSVNSDTDAQKRPSYQVLFDIAINRLIDTCGLQGSIDVCPRQGTIGSHIAALIGAAAQRTSALRPTQITCLSHVRTFLNNSQNGRPGFSNS